MEEDFYKMEDEVESTSYPYRDSYAFRKALEFVKLHDYEEYQALIRMEYKEMGGE